ncbi:hypothetical protein QOZ95_004639 [Paenibacillus brasilensis]|uniref:Uncharacterized protein n=1 Tax=Paenibacillus brasilensis TaxID=128574 RepID=A0ABU0L5C6_9BACL|nr:hypothetical protein [Paenibacillus brasilensis]
MAKIMVPPEKLEAVSRQRALCTGHRGYLGGRSYEGDGWGQGHR